MTVKPARVPCSSWAPALDAGHRAGALGSDHVDAEEVAEALAGAFEVGYRHFDCAAVYGNEENIGRVLEGLPREQMWAISKLWNNKHAEEDAALACRKSLADLRLDYLEMYLVHWPLRNFHARGVDVSSRSPDARPYVHEEFMATWGRMESLVDMRLTRHIGTSNMTVPKLALLLRDARIALSVNEMELHPHLQQPEPRDRAGRFLASWITARPARDRTPEDTVDVEDPLLVSIAERHEVHPAVACIKWAVQRGQTSLLFSTNCQDYEANLETAVRDPLSEDKMGAISGMD
jgi:alcohol dehydrogenase (NADP+)